MKWDARRWRRLNRVTHRDLGYFTSALVIAYCVSGIALNHIDAWNPDFIVEHQIYTVPEALAQGTQYTPERLLALSQLAGESSYKTFDSPHPNQVKIYFDNATLHVRNQEREAAYERVSRRPLFYQANILHRNGVKGWKWAADVFAILLIIINLTGLLLLKGKTGLRRRGIWFILAGAVPPIVALVLHG